jgi:hypothetical protein
MRKYKIFEQFTKDEPLEKFKAIENPILRSAAAADCFPQNYEYNVKHPITGEDTIFVMSKKEENRYNPYVFFKPNYEAEFRTSKGPDGKLVRTFKWSCAALKQRTRTEMRPLDAEFMQGLKEKLDWKFFDEVKPNEIFDFQLTDVATDKDLRPGGIYYNLTSGSQQYLDNMVDAKRPFYMYKPKKASAPLKRVDQEKDRILNQFPGYTMCSLADSEKGDFDVIDIDTKYPDVFEQGTKLCKPLESFRPEQKTKYIFELIDSIEKSPSRNSCRDLISVYYDIIMNETPISQNKTDRIRPIVRRCSKDYNFPGLKKKIDFMQTVSRRIEGQIIDYSIRESKDKKINSIVSESLFKLKEKKNPHLLQERKEVRKMFNVLLESTEINNQKDFRKFSNNLLGLMVNLRNEGYNERIISEQTNDMLGSLMGFLSGKGSDEGATKSLPDSQDVLSYLGKKGKSGLLSTFVETIGSGILSYMKIPPKGLLGTIILKTLSNIEPQNISKLSDCQYLSGLMTKSVLETIAAKFTEDIGGQSMFGSFIENTLFEMGEDTELFQTIKNYLGDKIICPYLEQKGGIMGTLGSLFTGG